MSKIYYYGNQAMLKHELQAIPIPYAAANRIEKLEAAMQKFVDKVDSGKARSKKTYAEFKALL